MRNYHSDSSDAALGCFGVIMLIVILIFAAPFIGFACGWVTGWIIKVIFGDTLIKGLALIGLNVTKNSLPLLCGTLGTVGSFFKSTIVNRKQD